MLGTRYEVLPTICLLLVLKARACSWLALLPWMNSAFSLIFASVGGHSPVYMPSMQVCARQFDSIFRFRSCFVLCIAWHVLQCFPAFRRFTCASPSALISTLVLWRMRYGGLGEKPTL